MVKKTPSALLLAAFLLALAASACLARGFTARAELAGLPFAPLSPDILTREEWQAKPPRFAMQPQKITRITLHHTGLEHTDRNLGAKLRVLQNSSQHRRRLENHRLAPALADTPYHFYIDKTGHAGEARQAGFAGDSNTRYDTAGQLQVVVEGNFQHEPLEGPEYGALRDLLARLMLSYGLTPADVGVHSQHAATLCPGKNLIAVLPRLLEEADRLRQAALEQLCGH